MRVAAWLFAACTLATLDRARADEVLVARPPPGLAQAGRAHAEPAEAHPARGLADVEEVYPRVDLNRADEAALLDLPGIGETRARAILAYRNAHGGFRSLSQLLQVKGIGRALLKRLRPLVTLQEQ